MTNTDIKIFPRVQRWLDKAEKLGLVVERKEDLRSVVTFEIRDRKGRNSNLLWIFQTDRGVAVKRYNKYLNDAVTVSQKDTAFWISTLARP